MKNRDMHLLATGKIMFSSASKARVSVSQSLFLAFFRSLKMRKDSKHIPRGSAVTCRMMSAVRALTPREANASPSVDDVFLLTMFSFTVFGRHTLVLERLTKNASTKERSRAVTNTSMTPPSHLLRHALWFGETLLRGNDYVNVKL